MNRRGFLRGGLASILAAVIPVQALTEGISKKRKWQSVLMAGVDEDGNMVLEFTNKMDRNVAVLLKGVQIEGLKGDPIDLAGVGVKGREAAYYKSADTPEWIQVKRA